MARSKRTAALLALSLAISGFAATAEAADGPHNRTVYSVNQPVVQRTDYVLDLSAPSGSLSIAERSRLRAWFDSLGLGYGDRVYVDEPYGPAEASASVARIAAEYGLLLSEGGPLTQGQVGSATVRVVVTRSTASVPGCPNWRSDRSLNSTSPNFGCATNSNLAAMVADPSDLVLGQAGPIGPSANAGTKAIKVYREAPPTGSKGLERTNSGGSRN